MPRDALRSASGDDRVSTWHGLRTLGLAALGRLALVAEVGQLTAVSECDLCAVAPKEFGEIVALVRPAEGTGCGYVRL